MPKVSSVSMSFGGMPFQKVINVNSAGKFSCKLPEFFTEILGYGVVEGSTLQEVEKRFGEAIKAYDSAKTSKRKVIVYQVEVSAKIRSGNPKVWFNAEDISFCKGLGISLFAVVCNEISIRDQSGEIARHKFEHVDSSLPYSVEYSGKFSHDLAECLCMEWTAEREDFFRRMGLGLEAVVLQLNTLKKPEQALLCADSGQLPGSFLLKG